MFERFTDRARRVVVLASEEARLLSHNYIGTEHILLGLIHEAEGVAGQVLAGQGVTLDATRAVVEEVVGRGQQTSNGQIPFTSDSRSAMRLALREALDLGHPYIGTEHLLLGLIKSPGVGRDALEQAVDLDDLRASVLTAIGIETASQPPSADVVVDHQRDLLRMLLAEHRAVTGHFESEAIQRLIDTPEKPLHDRRMKTGECLTCVLIGMVEAHLAESDDLVTRPADGGGA